MSQNQILQVQKTTPRAVARLLAHLAFIPTAWRGDYNTIFTDNSPYSPGDTINVRRDQFYSASFGDVAETQAVVETTLPLTIAPLLSCQIAFQPTDLQRKFVNWEEEVLFPMARSLAYQANALMYSNALTQIPFYIGSSSSSINSFASIMSANTAMASMGMNMKEYNSYMAMSMQQYQNLISITNLQNAFVAPLNKNITEEGMAQRLAGIDIFRDNVVLPFTVGTHAASGNVTVAEDVSSGNTINLTGFTPNSNGVMVPGENFQIQGTYQVFSIGQTANTNYLGSFVVQNTVNSDSSGNATVIVSPTIDMSDSMQNIYTSQGFIPSGSIINFVGNHTPNIVYTGRGCLAAFPPLPKFPSIPDSYSWTEPESGVTLRVSTWSMPGVNQCNCRMDLQLASAWEQANSLKFISAIT